MLNNIKVIINIKDSVAQVTRPTESPKLTVRGSPYVYYQYLLWEKDVAQLCADNKQQYIDNVDSVISACIPKISENSVYTS